MDEKKERVLFSREAIDERVRELGAQLAQEYADKELVVVSLLRGGFVFTADLVRAMDKDMEIDFMTTSSYGNEEEFAGQVKILQDIRVNPKDRHVLIVDDIMDTGHTMLEIRKHLEEMEPASVKTCVLLDKPDRRQVDLHPEYAAFTIPDVFIVGCGLDYKNFRRNTPYIYTYDD